MATQPPRDDKRRAGRSTNPTERPATSTEPNTVAAATPRERKKRAASAQTSDTAAAARRPESTQNSIQPSRRRSRERTEGPPESPRREEALRETRRGPERDTAGATRRPAEGSRRERSAEPRTIPEEIRSRFVQVGRHYYFGDGTRAFTDRGVKLTTPSENTEVIRSLVSIAQARGWDEISVRGTERFRKEAWFAARVAGLEVRGYRATEFERAHLVRILARSDSTVRSEGPAQAPASPEGAQRPPAAPDREARRERGPAEPGARGSLLTGRLVDHGRATYNNDPHEAMSYFVKLETGRGERTIWGVDLERAVKESLTRPQIGDEVGLRAVRQETVTVKSATRDAQGHVVGQKDLATHRNRWILEQRGFFEARAEAARTLRDAAVDPKQAVKQHPELVGTYLQVHAAELAAKQFRDPQDQQRFVTQVRSALADAVARGEPLPPVRLREGAAERRTERAPPPRDREAAPARG